MMETLQFKRVSANNESDIETIQKIYEASPQYFHITQGYAPKIEAAKHDLIMTPEGYRLDAKFFYAIYDEHGAIGCIDLIRAYPEDDIVFIGLLLFIESKQNRGYGSEALKFITQRALNWNYKKIRIAVIEVNQRALSFWLREGFVELYMKTSDHSGNSVIIMEKQLIK